MKQERHDIYGFRNRNYDREMQHIREWKTSERNKTLLEQFNQSLSIHSGKIRVAKVSSQIRKITDDLQCDLDKATSQDIIRISATYNMNSKWSEATKADYRRAIHQFYKWFEDNDERIESNNPQERRIAKDFYKSIKSLKQSYKEPQIDFSEIIQEQEIFEVARIGAANIKEKAFLTVLWESGCRAGEILNLRIKDIQILSSDAIINVNGKTGRRQVSLFKSIGYLSQWLSMHPFQDNKDSFVWLGDNTSYKHQPLKHIGALKLVDRCFKRALQKNPSLDAAKKWHNLHWFRHSRITVLASEGLNEAQLNIFAGWSNASKQAKNYTHLNSEQVRERLRKLYGIEEEKKTKATPCSCGLLNDQVSKYCARCGRPLNMMVAEKEKEYMRFAFKILSDPAFRKEFEEYKTNNGEVRE